MRAGENILTMDPELLSLVPGTTGLQFVSDGVMLCLLPLSLLRFLHQSGSTIGPELPSGFAPELPNWDLPFFVHPFSVGALLGLELLSEAFPVIPSVVSLSWTEMCSYCPEPPSVHIWYLRGSRDSLGASGHLSTSGCYCQLLGMLFSRMAVQILNASGTFEAQ